MKKVILFALAISLLGVSCEKEDVNKDITQPVIFEYEFINYAWGYRHYGWMIDQEGEIKGYKLPEKWISPDEFNFISKNDLKENLSNTDTTYGKVDNSELLRHFNNRFNFAQTQMDTSDIFMADAGTGSLYAYLWNTDKDLYERVLLASKGDISITNTGSKAISAVKWLKKVGGQTDRFFWFDL